MLQVWTPHEQRLLCSLRVFRNPVSRITFASDPELVFAETAKGEIACVAWEKGEVIERHQSGGRPVLALSPDGRRALIDGPEYTATIWDLASGDLHNTLRGHHWHASSGAFDPSGRIVTTTCLDVIKVWDVDRACTPLGAELESALPIKREYFGFESLVAGNGRHAYAHLDAGGIRRLDLEEAVIGESVACGNHVSGELCMTARGELVLYNFSPPTVQLWDPESETLLNTWKVGARDLCESLATSDDAERIAYESKGAVHLIGRQMKRPRRLMESGDNSPMRALSLSTDGNLLAAFVAKAVTVLDVGSGEALWSHPCEESSRVHPIALSGEAGVVVAKRGPCVAPRLGARVRKAPPAGGSTRVHQRHRDRASCGSKTRSRCTR